MSTQVQMVDIFIKGIPTNDFENNADKYMFDIYIYISNLRGSEMYVICRP